MLRSVKQLFVSYKKTTFCLWFNQLSGNSVNSIEIHVLDSQVGYYLIIPISINKINLFMISENKYKF